MTLTDTGARRQVYTKFTIEVRLSRGLVVLGVVDLDDGGLLHSRRSRGEISEVHLALSFLVGEIGIRERVSKTGVHPDICLTAGD